MRRLTIEHVDFDGAGVASLSGESVVIEGALPGERVEARWLSTSGRQHRAELLSILEPATARVTPFCRHAPECGGCTWQHVDYGEQLRMKRELVQRALGTALRTAPRVEAVLPSGGGAGDEPPRGFRRKVAFVVQERPGGRIALGHYRRRSHQVVEVQECPVHEPSGNDAAFWIRDALGATDRPSSARGSLRHATGLLRHLVLRVARDTGEKLATLVVSEPHRPGEQALQRALQEGVVSGAFVNRNDRPGPYLFGTGTRHLGGTERVLERVAGLRFAISPTSFFQTNIGAAEQLVATVVAAVPRGARRVLDLYAGSGLFALPLAAAGHHVVAVEESAAAIADGRASLELNGLDSEQCRFVRARVERFLFRHRRALTARDGVDAVVLDPPRDGCPPRLLATMLETIAPRTVIYVSCEPQALARDLASALAGPSGRAYRLVKVQPIDMFPHTAHIETVAVLCRDRIGRRAGGVRS